VSQAIAFWVFALLLVVSALGVVFMKNVFHSALALIAALLMMAGLFITLNAEFLAMAQIIIYVGAIAVIILLAIMLTPGLSSANRPNRLVLPMLLLCAVFGGVLVISFTRTAWQSLPAPTSMDTSTLAVEMFGENGFYPVLGIAGLLILATIVGVIAILRGK